jgi:hypothetical protein
LFLFKFWFVTEKIIKFWLKSFGRPLEYQNISCFGTPKSHIPKLYSSPFFCDAAGVVYITNFYHYLANHYTEETVTKLPATADLTLPLLCFCCLCHTAAVPCFQKRCRRRQSCALAKLPPATMLPLRLPPPPLSRCHHRGACHNAPKLPLLPPS